ncbi:hypothetical protein NON00_12920 [Roseomonas sp. GC11]|uniref:hypothetical protein n=1 Tax=Roseomonas sp. GC11 TaxID=2950546 RepID=UPI00210F1FC0|nr:hypothetical protein [Roseomonas sp. GC11]MCQ4160830.1 hypothetical protein [Roseomonas sp. GC11]
MSDTVSLQIRAPDGAAIWSGPADSKRAILLAGRHLLREWTTRSVHCSAWLLDKQGEIDVAFDLAAMWTARAVNDTRATPGAMRRRAERRMQEKAA